MPLRFLKPINRAGQNVSGVKPTTGLSPLQKITQQYRAKQAATAAQTSQQITELAKHRQRLTAATASATKANDRPLDNYLQRSGQMVEQRISRLQAKINGQSNDRK